MPTADTNPYQKLGKVRVPRRYQLTLECGHTYQVPERPHNKAKYACQAQQGCGYLLRWMSGAAGNHTFENPEVRNEA